MKFSVIITAHDEGFILARTLQSVALAARLVRSAFEVIVHLDKATTETSEIAQKYCIEERFRDDIGDERKVQCRVFENEFGDVGEARNFAAQQARGEYLFFIDGDDLISENYITSILKVLESSDKKIVASPEYCIEFHDTEKTGAILRMADSGSREHDAFMLFSVNLWVVAIAGRREIFLEHPYIRSINGYGHEDYALNIELTSAGIKHLVAPETVYFYRRKDHSRQNLHNTSMRTQPYSELFDFRKWQRMGREQKKTSQISSGKNDQRSVSCRMKNLYVSLRQNKIVGKAATKAVEASKKLAGQHMAMAGLPESVRSEWQKVAKLEPKVSPKGKRINALGRFGVNPYCPASEAYRKLCRQIKSFPDEVVLVDNQAAVKSLSRKTEKVYGFIILGCNDNSVISRKADDDAQQSKKDKARLGESFMINYAEEARGLSPEQRDLLLTRLLVQLKTTKLRVLDSEAGQKWLEQHRELTKSWIKE